MSFFRAALMSLVFGLTPTIAFAAAPQGEWMVQTNDMKVYFSNCASGKFCGYVAWMKNHGNAPVGKKMIFNVKQISDKKFRGRLINPFDGKEYYGTMTLQSDTKMRLRGCIVGIPFLCKSQTWRRQ